MAIGPGRPRRASRALLQEAAFELFPLRGYRGTSVELIARTAGFSRATFFNFFDSKAELFWLETDALLADLDTALTRAARGPGASSLAEVLVAHASTIGSAEIPWALSNAGLIEAADDLVASGAGRVLALTRMFERYLAEGEGEPDAFTRRARAGTATAILLVALRAWVDAGVHRGDLGSHVARAFTAAAPDAASVTRTGPRAAP